MIKRPKLKKAFTLVEIMTVITIIAILFVVLIPRFGFATDKAKEAGVKQDFRAFQTAAESSINEHSFRNIDDGNITSRLNEYLDESMWFTGKTSAKSNPWGNQYIMVLTKEAGDENSGKLEFINIKGFGPGGNIDNLLNLMGSKLVITVKGGLITVETIKMSGGAEDSVTPGDKTPTGITITKKPKTTFTLGDAFTYNGIEVRVNQADGTSRLTSNFTVDTPSMTVGQHTVTVRVNENGTSFTANYTITVNNTTSGGGGDTGGGGGDTGGGGDNNPTPPPKTLSSIGVTTPPSKMEYVKGESLNTQGLVIMAYFSDNTSLNVTSQCTFNSALSVGQTSVQFTYTYNSTTRQTTLYGIQVTENGSGNPDPTPPKALVSIGVSSPPSKMTYTKGDSLNTQGLIITAYFSDNTSSNITSQCTFSSSLSVGQTSVQFSYTYNNVAKQTTLYGLQVLDDSKPDPTPSKQLVSIEIINYPTKTSYKNGETLDIAGLKIQARFTDGTTSIVTSACNYNASLVTGQTQVIFTYTYEGLSKSVTLSGLSVTANTGGGGDNPGTNKTLTSISLGGSPKLLYNAGQNFDTTGLQVIAHFSDGSEQDVSNLITHDGYNLQPSVTRVNIYYDYGGARKSAQLSITVRKVLNSITVQTMPTNSTNYYVGENVNTSGLQIVATYSDGSTEDITSSVTISNNNNLSVGWTAVGVSFEYGGITKQTTFQVYAKEREVPKPRVLVSISVTKMPDKVSYWEGDTFSSTGLEITALYDDDTSTTISSYTLLGHTSLTVGTRTITVSYGEGGVSTTTTFDIIVKAKPAAEFVRLGLAREPLKTVYERGEKFNPEGMVVQGHFPDELGLEPVVTQDYRILNDVISETDHIIILEHTRSDGKTVTYQYTVHMKGDLQSIEITKQPTKTDYLVGEMFDPEGMEVTATFTDGSTSKVIPTSYTTDALKADTKTVSITYMHNGVVKSATVAVVVRNEVTGIEVTTPPTKTDYREGTDFDPAGMVVTATFKDGSKVEITPVIVDGVGLKMGQMAITMKYTWVGTTVTCKQPIAVIGGLAKSVYAGNQTTFFLDDKENIYAFGLNTSGQLGIGNTTSTTIPKKVDIGLVREIVSPEDGNSTFFLLGDGTVWATGLNTSGQLGVGSTSNITKPTKVKLGGICQKVVGGTAHTLFLMSDGSVYAAGLNSSGQIAHSNTSATQSTPYKITSVSDIIDVEAAANHSFFITSNGRVYTSGSNGNGQLGLNNTATQLSPFPIDDTQMGEIKQIWTCGTHTIFLSTSGRYYAAGANAQYQLATGDTSQRLSPTFIDDITSMKPARIILRNSASIFVLSDGKVSAIGTAGGKFVTNNTNRTTITGLNVPTYLEMDWGSNHVVFQDKSGHLFTSGENGNGQLGHGDTTSRYAPHVIFSVSNVVKTISAFNQLWMKDDLGNIWSSGTNNHYQLANGTDTTADRWVSPNDNSVLASKFDDILYTADDYTSSNNYNNSTLFVMKDNSVWGSGANTWHTVNSSVIKQLITPRSSKVKKIIKMDGFSAVLYEDGTLWKMGQYGQYSTNTTSGYNGTFANINSGLIDYDGFDYASNSYDTGLWIKSNKTVWGSQRWTGHYSLGGNYSSNASDYSTNMSSAKQVLVGPSWTMVLQDDGSVWSAGWNSYGQLGTGNTSTQSTYVKVVDSGQNVVKLFKAGKINAVSNNYFDTVYALHADGTVSSVGQNRYGQLGINSTSPAYFFTKITNLNGVKDIHIGHEYTIFETDNGIYGVGLNNYGQLGVGNKTNRDLPEKVLIDHTKVESINTYVDHVVYIMKDGAPMVCGRADQGAIGDMVANTTIPSPQFSFEMAS